jgi:hypothetical protein
MSQGARVVLEYRRAPSRFRARLVLDGAPATGGRARRRLTSAGIAAPVAEQQGSGSLPPRLEHASADASS